MTQVMPNGRKDSEFLKLDSTQIFEQQQAESRHQIKPFLTKLVSELQANNLIANLPRTPLNIKQLFTILSSYRRKKLFNENDIRYFLSNLYPEVQIEDFFSFKADHLTQTTMELFIKPYYDRIFVINVSLNSSTSVSMKINQLSTLNKYDYDRLSLQDRVVICEYLYMYMTYLHYEFNIEDFSYFTKLKIRFDNLVNELLPAYIDNADELYQLIQTGYTSGEPDLKIFNCDGQFNNLYLQIKNHVPGQERLSKEYFKTVITSDTSPIVDQIREKFDALWTDDPSEFIKFITTIPVELQKRKFVKDVFTNWMLHCMNQWFSSNGAVNKYILILQGEQNCGKDNFIKNNFLSPFKDLTAENFTFNTDNKDQTIMLASKLFALDGEMVCTTKQDITQIKKITGQNAIDYRTPYATKSMNYKRNMNFIGLTNNDELYRDESMSGGVRFLIIELNERFKFRTAFDPRHMETEYTKAVETVDWSKVWGYIYHLYSTDPNIIQKTGYIHDAMVEISEANRIKNPAEEAIRSYVRSNDNVKFGLDARQIKDKIIQCNNGLSKIIEGTSNKMFAKYLKNMGVKSYSKSNVNYYLCEVKNVELSETNLNPKFNNDIPPSTNAIPVEIDWMFESCDEKIEKTNLWIGIK